MMYYVNKQLNNVNKNKKTILVYLRIWKKKFGFFEKESKNCAELWFFIRKKRYEKYYVTKNFLENQIFAKINEIFWAFSWKYVKKCCASKASKTKLSPNFSPPQSLYCVINTPCTKFKQKNWRSSSKDCSKNPAWKTLTNWPKKFTMLSRAFCQHWKKTLNVYILSCDTVFKME